MKDYYKILGVSKKATKDEIKKAFYKLAHQHHPDKNGGDDKKFKEVNEAYQVLNDEKKRAHYDQFGTSPGANGNGQGGYNYGNTGFEGFDFSNIHFDFGDMGDIFDMFGGGRSGGRSRVKRGEDLQIVVEVTLAEAFTGINKKIVYNRHAKCETCKGEGAKPGTKKNECKKCSGSGVINSTKKTIFGNFQQQSVCPDCDGTGKIPEVKCTDCKGQGIKMKKEEVSIPVPQAVEDGEQLLIRGYGEGIAHGDSGDLYVFVRVQSDKKYLRKGINFHTKVDLKLSDLILGNKITIKDIQNKDLEVVIKEMQNPKEQIIVKGKGMQKGSYKGDLIIDINLNVPKNLSKKAKDLLEELKKEGI
jgi:molecular chaperone DnaJ